MDGELALSRLLFDASRLCYISCIVYSNRSDLFEFAEVVVFAQSFEVRHRLGVVEAVLVVDFTVACQLTKLSRAHRHITTDSADSPDCLPIFLGISFLYF